MNENEIAVIDGGALTKPGIGGNNVLQDTSKFWATNIHAGKTVVVRTSAGETHTFQIAGNSPNTLVLETNITKGLPAGSRYVISGFDLDSVIRQTLGGGVDVDLPAEFDALKTALFLTLEASVDTGTATGGSNTTIIDTGKHWEDGMWEDAVAEVVIDDVHYLRLVTSNTHDTVTINALPGGVECAAGCEYSLKRPVTSVDVTDRAARRLGVVENLTQWGGTALTGRDISLDLANLDLALTNFRDALRGADNRTLTDLRDLLNTLEGKDFATQTTLASQLNITLSALRDAIVNAATPKDLLDIYNQLEATLTRNITQIGGTAQTGADWTPLIQRLDVDLSTRAAEATIAKLIPIAKAAIFNDDLPAAEADWLDGDIAPTNSPSYLRIYVCVSVAGVLRVARTVGGTTLTEDLNSGDALTADAGHMFDIPWRTGDSVNIRYSVTAGTIKRLVVDEIGGAL